MDQFKKQLLDFPVEEVDRILFDLKMFAIYEIPGYSDYRGEVPTDQYSDSVQDAVEKRNREREAEVLKEAEGKAQQLFKAKRVEQVAQELAEKRFRDWLERRIPGAII